MIKILFGEQYGIRIVLVIGIILNIAFNGFWILIVQRLQFCV